MQQMRPVVGVYRAIGFEMMLPRQGACERKHVLALLPCVDSHYGPVAISPLVAIEPSSDTVAFWSTVDASSL